MPTYEYACTSCGQHIEVVQSMSAEPLRECGNCGGNLRKVFAPIGIVFKGSGFYRTDSRAGDGKRGGKSGAPASDGAAASKPDAKPDAKPESKPEAKGSTEKSA